MIIWLPNMRSRTILVFNVVAKEYVGFQIDFCLNFVFKTKSIFLNKQGNKCICSISKNMPTFITNSGSRQILSSSMVWSNCYQIYSPSCILPLHWASWANSVHAIGRFTYCPSPFKRKPDLLLKLKGDNSTFKLKK